MAVINGSMCSSTCRYDDYAGRLHDDVTYLMPSRRLRLYKMLSFQCNISIHHITFSRGAAASIYDISCFSSLSYKNIIAEFNVQDVTGRTTWKDDFSFVSHTLLFCHSSSSFPILQLDNPTYYTSF